MNFSLHYKSMDFDDMGFLICFLECKTVSMKCSSINHKPNSCNAETMILDVIVDTKHSQSACVFNESYGFKGKSLWVDNGCRATFNVKVAEGGSARNV